MTRKFGIHAAVGVLAAAAAWCVHAQSAPAPDATAPPAQAQPVANAPQDAGASQAMERQGIFKAVRGEVTVVRGDARSAAVVGGPLRTSDRVITGPQSAATISLLDGTVIELGAGSTADLTQFRFDSTTNEGGMLVNLARGTLRMITGLIAKTQPEHVKVTTPTAVIGVRGTDFIVEAQ
ncbi:MAG: FecR family protein [Burkholderiaceae bacterium]|nr:FecR family protein [Burkholderiaceae bacterium]